MIDKKHIFESLTDIEVGVLDLMNYVENYVENRGKHTDLYDNLNIALSYVENARFNAEQMFK